jgi:hypothetical protein
MAANNRYTNLSFSNLNDVGLMQLPYQQLDELLNSQQTQIDTSNKLGQLMPNYIKESKYATEAVKQLSDYQKGIKTKLAEVAASGDTRGYMTALAEANNKLSSLYKPGGLAYNLEQDYKTYTEDITTKQKALSDGTNKPWQYQTAMQDALANYDASQGTKGYMPIAKREAIDVNKLANDFVKNYQDNKYNKGELQIINGHVYHKNREISGVDAERVLQGLSATLKNAMFETGELEDLFKTQNKDNGIIADYRKSSLGEAQSTIDLLNKVNTKDEKEVTRLQQELNKYGANIEVDGKYGPQTQKAMDMARNSANEVVGNLSTVDDAALFEKAKDKYVNQYVQQLAAPYAQATARQKEEIKYTDMHETMGQWMFKEDYKAQKQKEVDREKAGTFRLEGTSTVFNPDILPKNSKQLDEATQTTKSVISSLEEEFNSTDDPQRRQDISAKIMWNRATLDRQNQLRVKAEQAVGASDFDKKYNLSNMTEQEKQILRSWQLSPRDSRKETENIALGILKKYNPDKNSLDLYGVLQSYDSTKKEQDEKVDEWLQSNASKNNFEMNTISLGEEESKVIKQSLNTNNWTFFNEQGPIDNKETGTLLGTADKPIISENVTIGGITKAPFGDFGNLVTLTDAKGKVYYASPKGGNVGKMIGNNIKNKAPEGSDQWMLGHMLSDPSSAGILGQMTDMQNEDSRVIVSDSNSLGRVEKKQVASGTLFTLHAPNGTVFSNGKTTMEYSNVENLTNDLQIINNSLNGTTGN